MNRSQLVAQIRAKKSLLCVGLDTDLKKLPVGMPATAASALAFNRAIIEATQDLAVAYKLNTAFYEGLGAEGWQLMKDTLALVPDTCLTIADAKRGDIGNTSTMYAEAVFSHLKADAITVAPYMGHDSVKPFLAFADKWTILLGVTSNPGSQDFQHLTLASGEPLYQAVVKKATTWASADQLMFVTGATQPAEIRQVRQLAPDYFFLVPGVGAQGGDLAAVCEAGLTPEGGLLINASRSILYASSGENFAQAARTEAFALQQKMAQILQERGIA